MQTRQVLTAYLTAAVVFLAIDAVWLTTMTSVLYRPALGHLLAPEPDLAAAALFYALYVAGMVGFAIAPGVQAGSVRAALVRGGALGLLCYATYDLTNQATMRGWPWSVTLADLAWGTFITGLASAVACAVVLRRQRA
jgi:uncharacterized membrane protein